VHLKCSSWGEKEVIERFGPLEKIPGWAEVPEDEKLRLLSVAGVAPTPDLLNMKSVFTGMTCILAGEFPEAKEAMAAKIEANGGKVINNVTKSVKITHVVLGADGRTQYGQPTGRRSKKYREAMKKKPKPTVVDYNFIQDAIKKGENIFGNDQEGEKGDEAEEDDDDAKALNDSKKRKRGKKGTEEGKEKKAKKDDDDAEEEKEGGEDGSDVSYDKKKLEVMKRPQIQALCKKHGIKANTSTNQMIEELMKLNK
jgi:hypothetical protein